MAIGFLTPTLDLTAASASYTIPANTTVMFAGALGAIGSDSITGATIAGNAMTLVGKVLNPGTNGRYTYLFRYYNPPTGTQTVAFSGTGLADGELIFYSGADTVTTTGTDTAADNTTAKAISVTTTVNNSWVFAYVSASNGNALSAGASTTMRATATGDGGFDTNAAITPAGATTINVNAAGGGTGMGIIKCELTAIATSGPANLKSLNTNIKSNIKSYNTNPIANIKSINTNV